MIVLVLKNNFVAFYERPFYTGFTVFFSCFCFHLLTFSKKNILIFLLGRLHYQSVKQLVFRFSYAYAHTELHLCCLQALNQNLSRLGQNDPAIDFQIF